MRCVTVLLLLVVGVVGCAPAVPAPTAPPSSTSATAQPRVTLPPRPREIRVDDLDPCLLLTPEQQELLELDGIATPDGGSDPILGRTRSCSFRGSDPREIAVGVTPATAAGIEVFTEQNLAVELTPITLSGFPALVVRATLRDDFCSVDVDIADGQLLDIQFAEGTGREPIPQDQLCRDAQAVADQVMITVTS